MSDNIIRHSSCSKIRLLTLLIAANVFFIILMFTTVWKQGRIGNKLLSFQNVYVQNIIFNRQDISNANFREDKTTNTSSLELPQKCIIPKLDPFHPDVKPFIAYFKKPSCDYPQLTRVSDEGFLQVADKTKVTFAKFAYIRRVNDDKNRLSDWIVFYDIETL